VRRHGHGAANRAGDVVEAVRSVVALHSTDPVTVFLSAWARTSAFLPADLERALYDERTLVRMLGMRRTLFVVPRELVEVVTVQNRYNAAYRKSEDVLEYCEAEGIGFIPWFPLATGDLAKPGGPLDRAAERLGATPSQVALAWLLRRSPVMLPIPGTSRVTHLEENTAAALLELDDETMRELELQTA